MLTDFVRRKWDESSYVRGMAELHTGVIEHAPSPEYGEDGVDLSLVRWMLSLTPAERLQVLDDHLEDVLTIRRLNAGR